MKVTFYSNFLNHHQLPLCEAMDKLTNKQFVFVSTTPIPKERLELGYCDMNKQYPFVLCSYESQENEKRAKELAIESDIVILGSAPLIIINERVKKRKLTFIYSERLYKNIESRVVLFRQWFAILRHHIKYMFKPVYLLGASAFSAHDYSLSGVYINKSYKWGYFPNVHEYDVDQLLEEKQKKERPLILWAGRFLDWKHPEYAIEVANRLKNAGYDFELNIIGTGELKQELAQRIDKYSLHDNVTLLGAMAPECVRMYMEKADLFLFTSNREEGWGAVLNEAMNSGCVVIASHMIGAVPFLIEHGKNGLIYQNENVDALYNMTSQLLVNKELRVKIGREAYQTIKDEWNAKIASERLIELSNNLIVNGNDEMYKSGPCSKAKIITGDWFI